MCPFHETESVKTRLRTGPKGDFTEKGLLFVLQSRIKIENKRSDEDIQNTLVVYLLIPPKCY